MEIPHEDTFTELTASLEVPESDRLAELFTGFEQCQQTLYGALYDRITSPADEEMSAKMAEAGEQWCLAFKECVAAVHAIEDDFEARTEIITTMMNDNRQGRYDTLAAASEGRISARDMDRDSIRCAVAQVLAGKAVRNSPVESIVSYQAFLMDSETTDYLKVLGIF